MDGQCAAMVAYARKHQPSTNMAQAVRAGADADDVAAPLSPLAPVLAFDPGPIAADDEGFDVDDVLEPEVVFDGAVVPPLTRSSSPLTRATPSSAIA